MSREVFEYFFEPKELEPYYSRLPKVARKEKVRAEVPESDVSQDSFAVAENPSPDLDDTHDEHESAASPKETASPASISTKTPLPTPNANKPVTPLPVHFEPGRNAHPASHHRVRELLSVHALGQYTFCLRSAILAAERGDDQDVDEPLPRLTFLPNFDRERIEEMLSEKLRTVGVSLLYFVSMLVLMAIGVLTQNRRLFYPIMFIATGYLVWLGIQSMGILRLITRRRAAVIAEADEPEPDFHGIEAANWWSMLKAGFEPVNYQRPFRHPELPLEGCPWRVLERGDLRIPVIRSGGEKLGPTANQLFEKHQVRLAAYAILLECTDHVQVPYGLVFPSDSPSGIAFEITESKRAKAVKILGELQIKLSESQQKKIEPRLPIERKRCEQCRYGKPEPIELPDIESKRRAGAELVVLRSEKGTFFHCDCADRFGSAPPHRDVNRLRLLAIIE